MWNFIPAFERGINSEKSNVTSHSPRFTTSGILFIQNSLQIYNNTILNRQLLSQDGRVLPILFHTVVNNTNRSIVLDTLRDMAREADWRILELPRLTPHGVPYFKDMYFEAGKHVPNCTFYGFTNADILFSFNLLRTLEAVEKV